jgi:hypothetical protein
LHVISPGRTVATLGTEQLIEDDMLKLLSKPRFAGQPQ